MPVSVFLSTLVSHLLAVALMVAAAGLWINQISIFLVLLPLYMLTVGLFAVGIGWIVASLHVFLRDTAQILSVMLTFWFWATPIFIEEGEVSRRRRGSCCAPIRSITRCGRTAPFCCIPTCRVSRTWRFPRLYGIGVFVVGGLFFRYMKRGFADVL